MAGCARSEIVRCGEVGVYHCWARCVRRAFLDKRGSIPAHLVPVLERLHINADNWLATIRDFDSGFGNVVGRVQQVSQAARRLYGMNQAAKAFT